MQSGGNPTNEGSTLYLAKMTWASFICLNASDKLRSGTVHVKLVISFGSFELSNSKSNVVVGRVAVFFTTGVPLYEHVLRCTKLVGSDLRH